MAEEKPTVSDDFVPKKSIKIFGRDIREIPCFRDSFIFGICGGVAGGLVCFMMTSKVLFSTHVGFGSIWGCVLLYWFPCRYKHESEYLKFQYWKKVVAEKQVKKVEDANDENSKV